VEPDWQCDEKVQGVRDLRAYTQSESAKNNDGGFNVDDDVLFFSKIDNQYIAGVIKDKKRDKLTKDFVYKIQKLHKRDPDVEEELSRKKRSAKEDPRVEVIKLREQRAKKLATITWGVKDTEDSYYKILSANDYQVELQLALLNLLRSKVKDVLKKKKKLQKLSKKANAIGDKMSKSKEKRDRKQRVAQTFGGTRQQMVQMASPRVSSKGAMVRSKSRGKSPRHSSKHVMSSSVTVSASYSDITEADDQIKVDKPEGNALEWTDEDVLTWLQWLSQNECYYENDRKLSDDERQNFQRARVKLFENYFEKFINAEIDGKKLSELNNVSLRTVVYMNNPIDKKIMLKALGEVFGERKKLVKASNYTGTEYDFSRDWKKSNRSELEFQKRKAAAGNLSKMTLAEIGRNDDYQGTQWNKDIEAMVSGSVLEDRTSKHSKEASFLARKRKLGQKRHKTVSEIGVAENYELPEYTEEALKSAAEGQATDERLIGKNGLDIDGENRELIKLLLHSNISIPPELTTPVKGYHTIMNRNAQLRNLLLKHQALMDDEAIANNPALARAKKLKEARERFEREQQEKEKEALLAGDLSTFTKTYGTKHKKLRQIKEIMKAQAKQEKKMEIGRKYNKRHRQNESSLALLKKRKQKIKSSSLALNDIAEEQAGKKRESAKGKQNGKRTSNKENTLSPKSASIKSRPMSAGGGVRRSSGKQVRGFRSNSSSPSPRGRESEKHSKSKKKKKKKSSSKEEEDDGDEEERKRGKKKKVSFVDKSKQKKKAVKFKRPSLDLADTPNSMRSDASSPQMLPMDDELNLSYDADAMTPTIPEGTGEDEDDENAPNGVDRMLSMHNQDNRTLVIHNFPSRLSNASMQSDATSYLDDDAQSKHDGGYFTDASDELVFSDDDQEVHDDVDDDDDDDEVVEDDANPDTVPLSVRLIMAQQNKEANKVAGAAHELPALQEAENEKKEEAENGNNDGNSNEQHVPLSVQLLMAHQAETPKQETDDNEEDETNAHDAK